MSHMTTKFLAYTQKIYFTLKPQETLLANELNTRNKLCVLRT